jgi:pimeloyl-ACP methyl ester carboxylesterase
VLVAVGTGPLSSAASRGEIEPKPTVVLVHGGWDNSTGWNSVVEHLQRRGFPVIAPANPLRDLTSDSEYISSILDTVEGPIVLVGHSYGGAVITNAAVGHDNVEALVYIAGFAPDEGESLFQLVTMNPGSEIGPETLIPRTYPLPDGSQGIDLYLTEDGLRTAFAADVSRNVADQMHATQRPFSQAAFESTSGTPAWATIPSWYLVASEDRAIPPATQRFMAERAGAQRTEVRARTCLRSPSQARSWRSFSKQRARCVTDARLLPWERCWREPRRVPGFSHIPGSGPALAVPWLAVVQNEDKVVSQSRS